jgi:hypothetical protein
MASIGNFSIWVALDQSMVRAFLRNAETTDPELARAGYMNERAGFLATKWIALACCIFTLLMTLPAFISFFTSIAHFDPAALVSLLFVVLYGSVALFFWWLYRRSHRNIEVLELVFFEQVDKRV